MRITVEGKVYEFQRNQADNVELINVERATGLTTPEWGEMLGRGSMLAITALVWILRRRTEPNLLFDEVVFNPTEVELVDDDEDEPGKEEAAS